MMPSNGGSVGLKRLVPAQSFRDPAKTSLIDAHPHAWPKTRLDDDFPSSLLKRILTYKRLSGNPTWR